MPSYVDVPGKDTTKYVAVDQNFKSRYPRCIQRRMRVILVLTFVSGGQQPIITPHEVYESSQPSPPSHTSTNAENLVTIGPLDSAVPDVMPPCAVVAPPTRRRPPSSRIRVSRLFRDQRRYAKV